LRKIRGKKKNLRKNRMKRMRKGRRRMQR